MTSTLTVADCTTAEPDIGGTADILEDVADYLRAFHDPEALRLERRARMRAKALRREMVEDRR